MEIELNFKGKDYSPLKETEMFVTTDESEKNKEIIEIIKKDKKAAILEKFLEKTDINNLIIGHSRRIFNAKLYSSYLKVNYFDGVVGVIRKKITFTKADLEAIVEERQDEEKDRTENNKQNDEIILNIKLQIQSRLDVMEDKKLGQPYFLSTMLLRENLKLNNDTVPSNEEEIYDYLLLFWFKEQLQNASLKGLYRTYRRFEKNDERLKGTIDIARHLRLNMGQDNGKIAYSNRENTINNYLNHMIVAAYDYLKKKYYDLVAENFDNNIELKSIIDNLRREIGYSSYTSYKLIAKNLKPISHPFYTEYEDLRKTCVKILRNEGLSIFDADSDNETKGILFYLPDLWEKYLQDKIEGKVCSSNSEIQMKSQESMDVFGFWSKDKGEFDNYKQKIRPDYVFYKGKAPFMILDAKFKPKWGEIVSSEKCELREALPDYDKCMRDMRSLGVYASGVIFPTNRIVESKSNNPIKREYIAHSISKANDSDRFYTIPVAVPYMSETEGYFSWKEKFDKNIQDSMGWLKNVVKCEKEFYEFCQKKDRKISEIPEKRRELDKGLMNSICDKDITENDK